MGTTEERARRKNQKRTNQEYTKRKARKVLGLWAAMEKLSIGGNGSRGRGLLLRYVFRTVGRIHRKAGLSGCEKLSTRS